MIIYPRPYQEEAIIAIQRYLLAGYKSVLLQLPTGGGKTIIAALMILRAMQRGKKCVFICNRIELLDQTIKAFQVLGIPFGIIAAGYPANYDLPIQIASVDTLRTRLRKISYIPDLVIWDECRSIHAAGWTKIYCYYPDAYHIGLDATPCRADGKPLADFFAKMVIGASVKELIAIGSLVPPRVYAPNTPDLTGVATRFGDYEETALSDIMNKPVIIGYAIESYLELGEGRSGIVFCVNIKHSKQTAADFNAAGIRAAHVDGETPKDERKAILDAYRAGEIQILCNVGLFCAGLDVPRVGYIASLRPTKSIALFLQQCGRGSRPDDGKKDYILCDHAGNVYRHGLPHDDREWSLEGRKKSGKKKSTNESATNIRQCPDCYCCHTPMNSCPECGHVYQCKDRDIKQQDGDLQEIDPETFKRRKRQEVAQAKTYEELQTIARARGYKPGWAHYAWEEKCKKAASNNYQQPYSSTFEHHHGGF